MSSVQRYFFRAIAKMISIRMNSKTAIPSLRAFSQKISAPLRMPRGVSITFDLMNDVPVEWITPVKSDTGPVILYLHGGAWVLGLYQNHRVLAAHLALASDCRVAAVDYRLAPEHPYPASLHDGLAVYQQLLNEGVKPHQIVFAGDSVGANLSLALLIMLRDSDKPLPAAAVCLSPLTDLLFTGASLQDKKDALLTVDFVQSMSRYYITHYDARAPFISPYYADLSNLPPLLIQTGEHELLLDDARRLAEKARRAGVDVKLSIWPRMWHVWHIFVPYLPEARQAVDEICSFVRTHILEHPT